MDASLSYDPSTKAPSAPGELCLTPQSAHALAQDALFRGLDDQTRNLPKCQTVIASFQNSCILPHVPAEAQIFDARATERDASPFKVASSEAR